MKNGILLPGGLLVISTLALSAPPERIREAIDSTTRVVLKGNIHPKVYSGIDGGVVEPWTKVNYMRLALKPSARQAAQLEQLLEQQHNPSLPDYQRWLTPEEFGERFGLSENDLDKITSWLESEGFTVEGVARAKNWVAFSGTAAQVSMTFGVELHRYSVDGEKHFANATEPSIPAAMAEVVNSMRGLDDFRPKAPRLRKSHPDYTSSSGAHYLAPDDLATIYDITPLYQAGFNGTGEKLVIVGQTDIKLSDISTFRSAFGLPANVPQLVLYGTDPGVSPDDQVEASLDLEWSGAVARNATIVYVYSQNVMESVEYAVDESLGTVMSMSYGGCETGSASLRSIAQQANAQGITWMNSAGDSGAAGCDPQGEAAATQGPMVTSPANIPEVTGVGGTEFVEAGGSAGWSATNGATLASATSYIPEKAWNDTSLGDGIEAGGGGASTVFTKPWWQTGPGVPSDGARDVPDVSLSASGAHDGYLMYAQGELFSVGGTSASSPSFAGIVTLLNQYLVSKGVQAKPGLGNINPTLYSLAQNVGGVFHDITAGNNIVPCKSGTTGCTTGSFGYNAGPGYDEATGLGSIDAYNLVTKWSGSAPGVGTTVTLTTGASSISQSGTVQLTAKVTPVSGSSFPTGSVAFTVGGQSLGSAALVAPASGTTASATLAVNGTSLSTGSNTIVATYTPTGSFAGSSASTVVTVTASTINTTTSVTANPGSLASTATTQLTATVKPASGTATPTGNITFALGSTTLGTAPLTSSGATLTVKGSSLAIGSNTITASFPATTTLAGSSGSTTVMVTSPLVATTTTLAANPATIASTASTQLTASVKAASGTATPTGTVTFSLGNNSLGSAPVSSSGASLTVKGSSLAVGSNTITASYTATGNFSSSSGSTSVTLTSPLVSTTTSVVANPTTIASTASTQLTASVKAASGTATPTGSITFALGSTALGSATLTASGATLTVKGSSLATGSNTITASYTPTGSFSASSATATVTVTSPAVATTTSVAANPTTIASTASTQLTATVKAASGTATPTGSVTFALGTASLGSAPVSSSGAILTVKGSILAVGNNTITASYTPTGSFSASSATATVTVTSPAVATTTSVAANPTTIASTASTQLTATVKAASGTATPTGSVTFSLGTASLGSASVSSSGASLTVKGSSLAVGSNTITASYTATGNFTSSSSSTTVTVSAPTVTTTTSVAANPTTIASTASTQLTVTVKAASGAALPSGNVTFSLGNATLGSAPLSGAVATLTVKGSSLASGSNIVTASYSGSSGFSGSSGLTTVTVTPPPAASVLLGVSLTTAPQTQSGLPITIQLQEKAGVATSITGFTINGLVYSSLIGPAFGATQLPAHGMLTANLLVQWKPMPPTLVVIVSGIDANGNAWSQTSSLSTSGN